MTTENIRPVKYVFLDVVAYTQKSIEAQCDIIKALNEIVKGVVGQLGIQSDSVIYLPTGDGICMVLINPNLPYDIHVTVANDILYAIDQHNQSLQTDTRKFEVRIGINQSEDNLVVDINERDNVAGSGINNARRIMDLADGGQILLSRIIYDILNKRDKYLNAFNKYITKDKHGNLLEVYQFRRPSATWLNSNPPSQLVVQPTPEPKLSKCAAYYFAHAIKNRDFILSKRVDKLQHYALALLLWYLARDSVGYSESTLALPYESQMPDTKHSTLDEQFEVFNNLPFGICVDMKNLACDSEIGWGNYKYFEDQFDCTLVNATGKQKLKSEWPNIWEEFQLSE